MDFKQIQELIKLINDSNIGEVTIEQKDLKLTIRQKEEATAGVQMMAASPAQLSYAPQSQQQTAPAASNTAAGSAASAEAPAAANTVTIKSPMIGTFYKRPAPDKPDFVSPGDEISVGKVVCIIEAMKLFNEIESEISGRIIKVLVQDASPVEYDQPLFLVEPS
jgi:acetyl-CoA carboxylase biotin carboxyl carrier protein